MVGLHTKSSLGAVLKVDRPGARLHVLCVSHGRAETGIVLGGKDVAVGSSLEGLQAVGLGVFSLPAITEVVALVASELPKRPLAGSSRWLLGSASGRGGAEAWPGSFPSPQVRFPFGSPPCHGEGKRRGSFGLRAQVLLAQGSSAGAGSGRGVRGEKSCLLQDLGLVRLGGRYRCKTPWKGQICGKWS